MMFKMILTQMIMRIFEIKKAPSFRGKGVLRGELKLYTRLLLGLFLLF